MDATTSKESTSDNRSDLPKELPSHSHAAWEAYSGMLSTKQRHYEFLEILENKKKKFNLSPTSDDKEQLAGYLSDHSEQVKQFTTLAIELKANHPESHMQLFNLIAKLGDGEPSKKTEH